MKVYSFYFDKAPAEMYYVSLVSPGVAQHPEYARIAVRGIQMEDESWKENRIYKTTALPMVKSLKLVDMNSLDSATMTSSFQKLK